MGIWCQDIVWWMSLFCVCLHIVACKLHSYKIAHLKVQSNHGCREWRARHSAWKQTLVRVTHHNTKGDRECYFMGLIDEFQWVLDDAVTALSGSPLFFNKYILHESMSEAAVVGVDCHYYFSLWQPCAKCKWRRCARDKELAVHLTAPQYLSLTTVVQSNSHDSNVWKCLTNFWYFLFLFEFTWKHQ